MLNCLPVSLIVGTILGFLTGLGIGGGSLLILWLTMILNLSQQTARGINLLFFLPSALIACLFRWQQGNLNLKISLPAILTGCITAFLFSRFSDKLDLWMMKKLFGILLLFTGMRELLYKRKPECQN